jgi:hypothetical protein
MQASIKCPHGHMHKTHVNKMAIKDVRAWATQNNHNNHSGEKQLQVFQATGGFVNHVRVCDVRESFDAAVNMTRKEKEEYFFAQGIDYSRAVKYWTVVSMFNRLYKFH